MSLSNFSLTSTGSGAPPDRQNLRDDRSKLVSLGWLSMAMNMVGTPGITVGLVLVISAMASSSTKRGMMMSSAPCASAKFITAVMANT